MLIRAPALSDRDGATKYIAEVGMVGTCTESSEKAEAHDMPTGLPITGLSERRGDLRVGDVDGAREAP